MTAPLTTFPDAELADLDRELLASLPLSYAPADSALSADVALVFGASDWPDRVESRLQAGAKCAVVVDPQPANAERVRSLATIGVPLVLSEPFAAHPAVPALASALGGTDTVRITSSGPGSPPTQLFQQIRLLRALGFSALRPLDTVNNASSVLSTLRGVREGEQKLVRLLTLTTTAPSPGHVIRGYGLTTVVTATLYGPETARPATIAKSAPGDTVNIATPLETAHRATLRQLSSRTATDDLDGFADDVIFFKALL